MHKQVVQHTQCNPPLGIHAYTSKTTQIIITITITFQYLYLYDQETGLIIPITQMFDYPT